MLAGDDDPPSSWRSAGCMYAACTGKTVPHHAMYCTIQYFSPAVKYFCSRLRRRWEDCIALFCIVCMYNYSGLGLPGPHPADPLTEIAWSGNTVRYGTVR